MTQSGPILGALIVPAMAYAGVAAAALPILIHLLNRRRFRRIRWAATDFLLEAQRRNRRRIRVEELILLALRCLAMALIGMTLARWFVQPRSLMAALGSSVRTDHFIVVDDSFSMTTRRQTGEVAAAGTADALADTPDGTTNTIFENARTAAFDIVRHIRRVAPEDSVTVLLSSRPDEPVRTAPAVGQVPESTWTEDIRGLQPCFRAGNMPAVFKAVRDRLDANYATLRAAVYVVSDFQTVDWLSNDRREPGNARTDGPGEPARPRAGGPPGGGPPGSLVPITP